jgi:predicted nucleic acid-binding protein
MTVRYVFDTGALVSAERGTQRVSRFFQLVHAGRARILVPLPVVAEWWRAATDVRVEILAATEVVADLEITKAAGLALARLKGATASLTIDAIVMATAAMRDAILVTQDPRDFATLASHFPSVTVLAV